MEAAGELEPPLPGVAVVEGSQFGGEIGVHLLERFTSAGLGGVSLLFGVGV